jgi:hypothetical protein
VDKTQGYWFGAKRYGWGWGWPLRWQGWVTLLLYAVIMTVAGLIGDGLDSTEGNVIAGVLVIGATVALIAVCLRTGEPPKWRWGDGPRR